MFTAILHVGGLMVFFIIIYFAAIMVHEYGHKHLLSTYCKKDVPILWYFKSWKDFGFQAGETHNYIWLNRSQLFSVYSVGILAGMAVIVFSALVNSAGMFLLVPYIIGCRSDIQQIITISRGKPLQWQY